MMTSHHIQYGSQHTLMKAMHTQTCTPKNPYPNERNKQTSVHTHTHTHTHTNTHTYTYKHTHTDDVATDKSNIVKSGENTFPKIL